MNSSIVSIFGSHLRNYRANRKSSRPNDTTEDPGVKNSWANIYHAPDNSILFRSIAEDPDPAIPSADAASHDPEYSESGMGDALRLKSDRVKAQGRALAEICDSATSGYIANVIDSLAGQHCRIGVIGQMNSGKSSLINALIQRPGFLPTDINPWTTVVTNLHFTNARKAESASFSFFSWDEWRRLAEGSPRIRALVHKLMPDFDWQAFAGQIDALQGHAKNELGNEFSSLQGQTVKHDTLTPEILEQYICAGSSSDKSTIGKYSAITKTADIHFGLDCFTFPTTLVDTPGVNDPYLVRDEITRQNLELADIYIVVLTARQPLSHADVTLLRLLRGLNKDRLIIFVNKADQIGPTPELISEIRARIKDVLAKQLNILNAPIIFGSANWAETALTGDDEALDQKLAASGSFMNDITNIMDDGQNEFWLDEGSRHEIKANALLARSGMVPLAAELSEMMETGPVPNAIDSIGAFLRTVAQNRRVIALQQAKLLEALQGSPAAQFSQAIQAAIPGVQRLLESLDADIAQLRSALEDSATGAMNRLRKRLGEVIAYHASEQAARLMADYDKAGNRWRCNTMPLRLEIEATLSEALASLEQEFITRQNATAHKLKLATQNAAQGIGVSLSLGPLPTASLSPAIAPLSEMTAVDPDSPAWQDWLSMRDDIGHRTDQLRYALETEFNDIADRLVKLSHHAVGDRIAAMIVHLRIVLCEPLTGWLEELRLASGKNGPVADEIIRLREQAEKCQDVFKTLTARS